MCYSLLKSEIDKAKNTSIVSFKFKEKYPEAFEELLKKYPTSIPNNEIEKAFLFELIKSGLTSTEVGKEYKNYSNRSSVRNEIFRLWDRNTTFSSLKDLADNELFENILRLVKDNISSTAIAERLKISRSKIDLIIQKNHPSFDIKNFGSLKTYLRMESIDEEMLKNLEKEGFNWNEIINYFIFHLFSKGISILKISERLSIPKTLITKLTSQQ